MLSFLIAPLPMSLSLSLSLPLPYHLPLCLSVAAAPSVLRSAKGCLVGAAAGLDITRQLQVTDSLAAFTRTNTMAGGRRGGRARGRLEFLGPSLNPRLICTFVRMFDVHCFCFCYFPCSFLCTSLTMEVQAALSRSGLVPCLLVLPHVLLLAPSRSAGCPMGCPDGPRLRVRLQPRRFGPIQLFDT